MKAQKIIIILFLIFVVKIETKDEIIEKQTQTMETKTKDKRRDNETDIKIEIEAEKKDGRRNNETDGGDGGTGIEIQLKIETETKNGKRNNGTKTKGNKEEKEQRRETEIQTNRKEDTADSIEFISNKILQFIQGNFKVQFKVQKVLIKRQISVIAKAQVKRKAAKAVAKDIPVLGFFVGVGCAVQRFFNGQVYLGLAELASGAAGSTGVGIQMSIGIQFVLLATDILEILVKNGSISYT